MNTVPQALIVALGDWYGVCRLPGILHRAGIESTLLVLPRGLARRTRYAKALPMEGYGVADLVVALREHLAANPNRYQLILPGDDMTMQALGAESDKEWLRPWFPVDPTPEKLDILLSTAGLLKAAEAAGLAVPRSILCRDIEHAVEVAAEIGYPVFFKGEQSSGGAGVGRATNEAELRQVAQRIKPEFARTFGIQKAITGPTGSTTALAWKGEIIQWMGSYKASTWPGPYGISSARTFLRHPDLEEMVVKMGRATGFSGFFSLDWIRCDQTDRCYIVEMNPRPTPEITASRRDGEDFSVGFRHLFCGGPKPKPQSLEPASGRFALFPQELFRCYDERDYGSFARMVWDIIRRRDDVPWDDRSLVVGIWKKFQHHRGSQREKKAAAPQRETAATV